MECVGRKSSCLSNRGQRLGFRKVTLLITEVPTNVVKKKMMIDQPIKYLWSSPRRLWGLLFFYRKSTLKKIIQIMIGTIVTIATAGTLYTRLCYRHGFKKANSIAKKKIKRSFCLLRKFFNRPLGTKYYVLRYLFRKGYRTAYYFLLIYGSRTFF